MKRYRTLLTSLVDSRLAEDPPFPLPPELELQALWFAGTFGRDFIATTGEKVRIAQFGEWNRGAGPDFLHTAVEIAGDSRHGAIELDLHPTDWESHGHGANADFNGTVLHVVFHHSGPVSFTRTSENKAVPQVRIPPALLREALQLGVTPVAIARTGRCARPLAQLSHEAVLDLLHQAAEHRASLKAARFLRTAEAHGRDAALFQATAETLGYRPNALAMRLLAQRLPLAALREDSASAEALLFGAAGFLHPDLHEKAPPDTRERLRDLWDQWWKHRARWESAHPIPWKPHGQRPANHPHRRVAALATLAAAWPRFRQTALGRPFDPRKVIRFLEKLDHPFWSRRHTLTSATSARPVALFGKSRALELLANHLVPLALHEDPSFAFPTYAALPAPAPNDKVRRAAIRLFGSEDAAAPYLRKLPQHQALLQIYQDFCLQDLSDCEDCPFPEQLSRWTA